MYNMFKGQNLDIASKIKSDLKEYDKPEIFNKYKTFKEDFTKLSPPNLLSRFNPFSVNKIANEFTNTTDNTIYRRTRIFNPIAEVKSFTSKLNQGQNNDSKDIEKYLEIIRNGKRKLKKKISESIIAL